MLNKKLLITTAYLGFFTSLSGFAQPVELKYGTGNWNADTLGNHRVVLKVEKEVDAVYAYIPWRRSDSNPEKKDMILVAESAQQRILNLVRININPEFGEIVFQPQAGPGTYFLYYLPYRTGGSRNYPKVYYPIPNDRPDHSWISGIKSIFEKIARNNINDLPKAKVVEIQSIDEFNSFYPMEVIATGEEVEHIINQHPGLSYLLFPEDRKYPIRMTKNLPYKWISEGVKTSFTGKPERNEYYAFQFGLFALKSDIEDLKIKFSNLTLKDGNEKIPGKALTCFNTGGINWDGKHFDKVILVKKGNVQALWFGVDIPENITPGLYKGTITISTAGLEEQSIDLALDVQPEISEDRGDVEPWRHSRMRWLNSRLAFDDSIVSPFIPLKLQVDTISCLGRKVILNESGIPEQIINYFSPEVTNIQPEGHSLLAGPIEFIIEDGKQKKLKWKKKGLIFTKETEGTIEWKTENEVRDITIECFGKMEFDGFLEFRLLVSAQKDINLKDIRLEIPIRKEFAKYMMGLGLKGRVRPDEYHWKWDQMKNQEGAWIGNVNGGIQYSLRGANYSRPLNTNFYLSKPLNLPVSWYNDGKGGSDIFEKDENTVIISSYSGPRVLKAGDTLYFNFNLLLTPFKPIDTKEQWSTRFYHRFDPVDTILRTGANTVNVHHANNVNPYINYPFIHQEEMKSYIEEAHQKGLKVKIYNTIRELSNRAAEFFAIRSLGHEIFSAGPGDGFSWLQEHLGEDYIPAWFVPHLKDAAIINSGMSRWHNYYVEGLNWLTKNMEIDGLYIDDVAFDRTTMKRVRKILDRNRNGALIDLHSANQFNVRDGYANSANLYMEHFPYINRLWFGEYFDKDSPPDFWLVEMSGIPYGLMGEMLQDGGNQYRGMLYGMTARLPWAGNLRPIWEIWDEFGIQESEMIGYWSPNCPVKTNNEDILATVYQKKGKVLVSIGSWAEENKIIELSVNWDKMGINPSRAKIRAPYIENFQKERTFKISEPIPVEQGKGWLLIILEE
ncbi:MAG: hypothetical protein KAX05_05100 [Bacteroidales bacterium]|nr:hypothetical protein [Bacteroidales bacterium]